MRGAQDTARVAVWLLARSTAAAGDWFSATPKAIALETGLSERDARDEIARLVSRGYVALQRRSGEFWLTVSGAGRQPLQAHALQFAASMLGAKP